MEEALGIDFGGSGIKGAPVNVKTGELITERFRIDTPSPSTPEAVADVIDQIAKHFNWHGKIGVGFPSVILHGKVLTAANIDKSWIGVEVDKFLSQKTGCSVFTINDADAAGTAAMTHGAGKGEKGLVLFLTIGTGIGSVLFINGHMVPNSELGHVYFNGTTIEKYAADSVRKKLDLSWKKYGGRLNEVLNYLQKTYYPDLIILGGGISKKYDKIEEFLQVDTKVVPAVLLNDAGIIGSAMYAARQK
jgi:polyphosphate glucokinase